MAQKQCLVSVQGSIVNISGTCYNISSATSETGLHIKVNDCTVDVKCQPGLGGKDWCIRTTTCPGFEPEIEPHSRNIKYERIF